MTTFSNGNGPAIRRLAGGMTAQVLPRAPTLARSVPARPPKVALNPALNTLRERRRWSR